VLLAARDYLRPLGVRAAAEVGASVLVRLRWSHCAMVDRPERSFNALEHAKKLKLGQVGAWPVKLPVPAGKAVGGPGSCHQTSCPAGSQGRTAELDPRTLQAAHVVMVFTTPARDLAQRERRSRTLPMPLADRARVQAAQGSH